MKSSLILLVTVLLVSACSTPVKSPENWEIEAGKGFNKTGFNLDEYVKQSHKCFFISQKMNKLSQHTQKDGYIGCMKTRGYELVSMPQDEITRREYALNSYIKLRTPTKTNFYDKPNFQDHAFVSDVRSCQSDVNQIKKNRTPSVYSPNTDIAFFSSIFNGIGDANTHRKNKVSHGRHCMFKKGYVLSELPESERKRRHGLIN